MTELELRNLVAKTALEYIGVKESDGSHRKIIDRYNSIYPNLPLRDGKPYKMSYTDDWCAGFISYLSIVLGLTDILPVECSCTEMIKLHKVLGQWIEDDAYTPKAGDLIMYYWKDGTDYATTDQKNPPNHVGIVTKVEKDIITVVEGNKGEAVATRKIKINGRYIRGYCTPDYALKAAKLDSKDTSKKGIYKQLKDVPADYKPTIEKLMKLKGPSGVILLTGYENPDPDSLEDNVLNLSEDFCRVMTVLDRAGLFEGVKS